MITKQPEHATQHIASAWYVASARTAWRYLLQQLDTGKSKAVLLPAYIGYTDREGSGVFDPVLSTGMPYRFYGINRKFEPDLDEIEAELKTGEVGVLLVIHYFGFCTVDVVRLRELANQYGAVLVEDCAHAYTFGRQDLQLGYTGDFSFYSLHKFFATTSGGILVSHAHQRILPAIDEQDQCDRTVLEHVLSADTKLIIEIRRRNYAFLYQHFKNHPSIRPLHAPGPLAVPQSFPVFVQGVTRADLYFRLMEKGCPTIALYYRMIDQIDKERFAESYWIADHILNLPVHQDTTVADLAHLCEQIEVALEELTK